MSEALAAHISQDTAVQEVFGEPIQVGDKTIIPVAKVTIGFGHGLEKKIGKYTELIDDTLNRDEESGGGGGMIAKGSGVYEVSAAGTKFIPANGLNKMVLAAVVGFILSQLLWRRKK